MDRSASLPLSAEALVESPSQSAEVDRFAQEEFANQLTHGLGFALSCAGGIILLGALQGSTNVWQVAGCHVYVWTLIALYAASTLSHSFHQPALRSFFRMLDQVCIFLMMAGSFTPFVLVHVRNGLGWSLLLAAWLFAVIGIVRRIRNRDQTLPIMWYVVLGWFPLLVIGRMAEVGDVPGLLLVMGGWLSYLVGTLFLQADEKAPYFHAVWHILVIVGSICHFTFLLEFVAKWPMSAV
jgi:hemolysin III